MVREGYKMTALGEIPEGWEVRKLGDIANIVMGQSPSSSSYNKDGLGLPFFQGKTEFGNIYPSISKWCSNPIKISKPNDVLVCVRAPVGDVNINIVKSCIGRGLAAIQSYKEAHYRFIYYLLKKKKQLLENLGQGSTFTAINRNDLKNLKLPFPPLPEQQKIADILSTVDKQIEQTDQLIEKTKELKKGLMQRLLTKGIGHTKFKKTEVGEIPVGWEVRKLGDLCHKKPSYGANESAIEYDEELPRYVRITDIREDGKLIQNDKKSFPLPIELSSDYILKKGDIVFARTGATVGKTYMYREEDGICVYAGYLIKFIPTPNRLTVEYLFYFTHSEIYYRWVKSNLREGVQPNINSKEYSILKIPLPPLPEQQKIADILSSVDEQIEQYETKKEKLQHLKKGLMQQLLTGKIRVKV